MTRSGCESVAELLAAFADGGLDGVERERVESHVGGCAACRDEVKALRETLAAVQRAGAAQTAEVGEDFWRDFGRDTRLAYERAKDSQRGGVWPWLRNHWWKPAALVAVGAAVAIVLATGTGTHHGEQAVTPRGADAGVGPGGVAAGVGDGTRLVQEIGPESVDDMEDEQLDRVLSALDPVDDDDSDELTDEEADSAETAAPYEAIEDLDDEEITRVLDALMKGV